MFEPVNTKVAELESCAAALHDSVAQARLVGATRLARVADWADLHAAVEVPGVRLGGEGTPKVTDFAVPELGCLLQTTTHSAAALLRDALDLRHRLPRLWDAVMTGELEDYKARHVARMTRSAQLTQHQAHWVDGQVIDPLVGLPWGRAMLVVEAMIVAADPEGHERRQVEAADQRYVIKGRRQSATGLQTLITCTTSGDIARLDAMADHLAEVLRVNGDTDDLQVRRTKAIAILADPARACMLLAQARSTSEPTDQPVEEAGPYVSTVDAASELGTLLATQGATALARLRPRIVLYVHISEEALQARTGVARVEGLGPVRLRQLQELIGRDAVTVTPVLDPTGQTPVDAYEVPRQMREAMDVRQPFEVFPWGTLPSRQADQDHTIPYRPPDEGGPPGQTRVDNLGPLARSHHNAKTFGGFQVHQSEPGVYLWRTPAGYRYRVDAGGTTALGREQPAVIQRPRVRPRSAGEAHFAALIDAAS